MILLQSFYHNLLDIKIVCAPHFIFQLHFLIFLFLLNFCIFNSDESVAKKAEKEGVKKPTALEEAQNSRKRVNLIDAKRAQNAGIALARIKVPFAEIKER